MPTTAPSHRARAATILALLLAGCGACGPKATAPEATPELPAGASLEAHLLLGESPQALQAWTTASAEERAQGTGMLGQVDYGQMLFVRVAVTGFTAEPPFALEGSMSLLGPDGRTLHEQPIAASEADLRADAPGVLVLSPGMDIIFDPGDPTGTYRLRGSVLAGERSLDLQRELQVQGGGMQLDPAMGF
jgi:hypothetical protein